MGARSTKINLNDGHTQNFLRSDLTRGGGAVSPVVLRGSGGVMSSPGDGYTYHTFTAPGNLKFVSDELNTVNADVVIIGAGGGGGSAGSSANSNTGAGGGGGAGGTYGSLVLPIAIGEFTITIGNGGLRGSLNPGPDSEVRPGLPGGYTAFDDGGSEEIRINGAAGCNPQSTGGGAGSAATFSTTNYTVGDNDGGNAGGNRSTTDGRKPGGGGASAVSGLKTGSLWWESLVPNGVGNGGGGGEAQGDGTAGTWGRGNDGSDGRIIIRYPYFD